MTVTCLSPQESGGGQVKTEQQCEAVREIKKRSQLSAPNTRKARNIDGQYSEALFTPSA
jgi:hypothetical protein